MLFSLKRVLFKEFQVKSHRVKTNQTIVQTKAAQSHFYWQIRASLYHHNYLGTLENGRVN